jgi:hypothetical protein
VSTWDTNFQPPAIFAEPPAAGTIAADDEHTFDFVKTCGLVYVQNESEEEVRLAFNADTAKSISSTLHSYCHGIVKAGETRVFQFYCNRVTVHNNGAAAIKTEDSAAGAADQELLIYGMRKE